MKKFYIICLTFFISCTYGQVSKSYTYYIEMSDISSAPTFKKINNKLTYEGNDLKQKKVFSKYNVLAYEQAFPDAIDKNLLKIYVLKTTDKEMVSDLLITCKENFKSSSDITDRKIGFLYQPNDYGTTSTVPNLGANVSRKDLDYLNAPAAWDITKGNSTIKVGISDSRIKYDLPDLYGKVIITSQTPPYLSNSVLPDQYGGSHGTSVAALAAARGNNAHGSVGVCMDCDIVEGSSFIGEGRLVNGEVVAMYSNLYKMAKAGARVINMSWWSIYYTNSSTGDPIEQAVINDLVNNYKVTLVAAAGNYTSFSTATSFNAEIATPTVRPTVAGILYIFPASYDNVISVSSINHKYPIILPLNNNLPSYCCLSNLYSYPIHIDLEDSVSPNISNLDPLNPIGLTSNGNPGPGSSTGLVYMHTLNDKVDLLATGYSVFDYYRYTQNTELYKSGTSYAAPMVTGTIGLMLSLDECLRPNEIENILKLTAKDIEQMPINTAFNGLIGAGKLEIGNAVKFVDEMIKPNGNSIIENHIFNRFNFSLSRINNKLTIKNVIFKENCTASFTARNVIEIAANSDFVPNSLGSIDLKLKSDLSLNCSPVVFQKRAQTPKTKNQDGNVSKTVLYPNPNKGIFTIDFGFENKNEIEVGIYDTLGRNVYKSSIKTATTKVNLPNLPAGLYLIQLQGDNYSETIKFIKE
ncbi:S8 family serine peptidase [Flavobacterium sp.]|uniref:S8 family serine peptidase n=1 Tax=Flavobacterium sp. TaxID=239 RepID=UPI00286D8440|nr:S8 family serine peptidase [Flavobacterium sp.]